MTSPLPVGPIGEMTPLRDLMDVAENLEKHLEEAGFLENPVASQALAIAEEAGELVGAIRRYAGMARRRGSIAEVEGELADVIITAFVTAQVLRIDVAKVLNAKLEIIYSRGWRES